MVLVLYGVVLYSVIRCGKVWFCAVWWGKNGFVLYDMVWCGLGWLAEMICQAEKVQSVQQNMNPLIV